MKRSATLPFYLLTATVAIALVLSQLIQDGMFMDAVLYTSVAHNLANGIGNFWYLQFSYHNVASLPSFHEQPPLVFGIQSLFFRVFGDSLYVERGYTFLMFILTAWLIHRVWIMVQEEDPALKSMSWLPVLCWVIMPTVFWSYSNNMLENTMGVFTLLAVIVQLKAYQRERLSVPLALLSGLLVFLATLSKGIPGLFPLAVPLIRHLVMKDLSFRRACEYTILAFVVPLLGYLLLLAWPYSRHSLYLYFVIRAMHRIQDVPTVGNRFYTLTHLFMDVLPQLILLALLSWRRRIPAREQKMRSAIFFALTGLAASVPLMLTMVQKSFYYVPALPFFALALAFLFQPFAVLVLKKVLPGTRMHHRFTMLSWLLLAGSIVFTVSQAGHAKRDRNLLHDIYLAGKIIPSGSLVSIDKSMLNEWDLQSYLMRYFYISSDWTYGQEYCIIDSRLHPPAPTGYQKEDISTLQYHVYRRVPIKEGP